MIKGNYCQLFLEKELNSKHAFDFVEMECLKYMCNETKIPLNYK
jgi:hypothetical protein